MKGGGNKKCLAYVAIFIVFQIIVITIFALTIMKIKGPKVRFDTPTVTTLNFSNSTSASFSAELATRFVVKNTNFGHFKYPNSTVSILYEGQMIGTAVIPAQKAKARSTRKTDITISIDSSKLTGTKNLSSAINARVVPLTSESTLKGKVELMKIIKKNKSGKMSCTMSLNLSTETVNDLKCK